MESFSLRRLEMSCPIVKEVAHAVDKRQPIRVLQVVRYKEEHDKLLEQGYTKIPYEETLHNPNHPINTEAKGVTAFDIVPLPFTADDWKIHDKFYVLHGVIKSVCLELDVGMVWGGDWNGDGVFSNDPSQKFFDLPHYQFTVKG